MRFVESSVFWNPPNAIESESFDKRDLFLTISVALSSILFISAIVGNHWGLGTIGSVFLLGMATLYIITSTILYFFKDTSLVDEDSFEETEISLYDSCSELPFDEDAKELAEMFIQILLHTNSQQIERYKEKMEDFLGEIEDAYQRCFGKLEKGFEEINRDNTIVFLKESILNKIHGLVEEGKIAGNECLLEYYLFNKMRFLEETNLKNYILTLPNLALEIYSAFIPENFQQQALAFLTEAKRL